MSNNRTTDFDILIEHDLDIRARIIYVQSDIDDALCAKFIKLLKYLDKTSGDIQIVLNSGGGCVTSGFAMHDAIKACNNPVTVKVYGRAMSAATVILQAGDLRIATRYTRFMIHRGETEVVGDFNNVKKLMKENEDMDKILSDIYFNRMKEGNPLFKRAELNKMMDVDFYFSAEKALELGLIDEIEGEED